MSGSHAQVRGVTGITLNWVGRPPHCPAVSDPPTAVNVFHNTCLCFEQSPHHRFHAPHTKSLAVSLQLLLVASRCAEILCKARRMCLAEVRLKVKVATIEREREVTQNSQALRFFPTAGPFFQKAKGVKMSPSLPSMSVSP